MLTITAHSDTANLLLQGVWKKVRSGRLKELWSFRLLFKDYLGGTYFLMKKALDKPIYEI